MTAKVVRLFQPQRPSHELYADAVRKRKRAAELLLEAAELEDAANLELQDELRRSVKS